ncbi:MAG: hypothetical protein JW768_08835 [Chitinispirillaceae bacterium]|nr:hypothetical protein [Chitinispirillaceae bacterium]
MLFRCIYVLILSAIAISISAAEMSESDLLDLQKQLTETLKRSVTPEQAQHRLEQLALYQKEHPLRPLKRGIQGKVFKGFKSLQKSVAASGATPIERVLVLCNETLYGNATAKQKIDRYIQDVRYGHGCTVILETLEGGTPPQIKAVIKEHYNDGGINGVVQIGDLPPAWYESDNDPTTGRYDHFTCDLYYMDMDGSWTDADNNGEFDNHTAGSGDIGIDIFYGRLDATTMGNYGSEVEVLGSYLDKLHNYYMGGVTLNKAALGYLDYDWRSSANYLNEIYPGSSQNELIRWTESNPPVNKSDYLNNRLQKNYSALQMWCHANYNVHGHHTGGSSSMTEVYNAKPKPIAYFHDGCHVSDFAAGRDRAFLGGSYVFNESPTALICMSGSRSGQWIGLMARVMFQAMAKNTCIGQAFLEWFGPYENSDENRNKQNFIGWNYGYNFFGDPMITLITRNAVDVKEYTQKVIAPSELQCVTTGSNVAVMYSLPQQATVALSLFDMKGKLVRGMANGLQQGGVHTVDLNTAALPVGTYVVSLSSTVMAESKRINVVR